MAYIKNTPDHDRARALILRLADLRAQMQDMRKEQIEVQLEVKDWMRKQNTDKAIIAGFRVNLNRTWSTSFSKTRILECYGPEKGKEIIDKCGRKSESISIELTEIP